MHFTIDGEKISEGLYPCLQRFLSKRYQTDTVTIDGKVVESVDGADNLDSLFKRSLTRKGEIVSLARYASGKEEEATKSTIFNNSL